MFEVNTYRLDHGWTEQVPDHSWHPRDWRADNPPRSQFQEWNLQEPSWFSRVEPTRSLYIYHISILYMYSHLQSTILRPRSNLAKHRRNDWNILKYGTLWKPKRMIGTIWRKMFTFQIWSYHPYPFGGGLP